MRNRPPVLLQNSPTDDDSLAYRFSSVLPRKVAGFRIDRFFSKRRPGHLRKRVRHVHQRFRRGTFDGGRVRRMKMLWLCTRGRPLVSRDVGHPMILLLLDSAKTQRPQPATFEGPPANRAGSRSARFHYYCAQSEPAPDEGEFLLVKPIIELLVRLSAKTRDRKSTRLNSSHQIISYAVFCLKKKKKTKHI